MDRRTLLASALGISAVLRKAHAQDRLTVVATFSILADMARVIGGGDCSVTSLVPFDGDAHAWEPKPADLRAVGTAGVLIENGLGLEGWMTRLPQAAGFHGVKVTASRGVSPRKMVEDGKSILDPHAWQDPANGMIYASAIGAALGEAIPAQKAAIRERTDAYVALIEETDRWISQTLSHIPPAKRRILTSHDAFGYYGARYGITLRAVQGISTETEPSAKEIAALIRQIRQERIKAVFVENMTNRRLAQAVAQETGAVIGAPVYSDALSAPDGPAPTYLSMLRHNTTLFAAAMAENPG
jgi:zinc/manganese transport system substrate-binding protein